MRELGVKTIIGLTSSADMRAGLEETKEGPVFVQFPYNEKEKPRLEFDEIFAALEEKPSPAFVFCPSGMLAAAFAAYFLMRVRGLSREAATMLVMKGRPETRNMPSWLYSQITYEASED